MIRKSFGIVIVVSMLVLAGCTGGGGGAGTADQSQTTSTVDAFQYPEGVSENGVDDPWAIVTRHEETVRNASSYRSTFHQTYVGDRKEGGSSTNNVTRVYVVDYEDASLVMTRELRSGTIEDPDRGRVLQVNVYRSEGKEYVYSNVSGDDRYAVRPTSFNQSRAYNSKGLEFYLKAFEYQNPTVERDGETSWVTYTATSLTEDEEFTPRNGTVVNSAASKLTVDEDGYIRYVSFEINVTRENGDTRALSGFVRFSELGDAVVEKPDWVSTAKEQSN